MAAGGKLNLRFLLLQSLVMVALCCQCKDRHMQEQFCNHEYVLKGLIKDTVKMPYKVAFVMEIKKIYKGDGGKLKYLNGREVLLVMPHFCANVLMEPGDTYLILGDEGEGKIHTHACSGSIEWKYTKTLRRLGLHKEYSASCNCVSLIGKYDFCRWKHSYLKNVDGQCKWAKTSTYDACLEKKKRGTKPRPFSGSWD